MTKKILHLANDHVFDRDFPASAVLDILRKTAVQLYGEDEDLFTVDVTTLDEDFFHNLTFSELDRYFKIFKNVINSITLTEKQPQHPGINRSIVLYLNTTVAENDLTFTIITASEEEHLVMEMYVEELLKKHTKAAKKTGKYRQHEEFLFDNQFDHAAIVDILQQIDETFLEDTPLQLDVYLTYDEILVLVDKEMTQFRQRFQSGEYRMLTVRKQGLNGSGFELFLHFNIALPGFAYYTLNADKAKSTKAFKEKLNDIFGLDANQQKQLKARFGRLPVLQGSFLLDSSLTPAQIADFAEMLGDRFLPNDALQLRYINADNSCYSHEKPDFDRVHRLFQSSGSGSLYLTKRAGKNRFFRLVLSCRNGRYRTGFYYIASGNPSENEVMETLMLSCFQPQQAELQTKQQTGVRPQLQGSFFFPTSIDADAFVGFLDKLSKRVFPDDFIALRLNCANGDKHLYYDEDYSALKNYINKDEHQVIYINKKTKSGASLSVHLQFKNTDAGTPNAYYSIVANNDRDNIAIREFLQEQLRRTVQQKNGEEEEEQEMQSTGKAIFKKKHFNLKKQCYVRIAPNEKELLAALSEVLGTYKLDCVHQEGLEGFGILDTLWQAMNESELLILDISGQNSTAFYELGIAHTLKKDVILLVQDAKSLPFDFKPFRHIIYEADEIGLKRLKAELAAYLK